MIRQGTPVDKSPVRASASARNVPKANSPLTSQQPSGPSTPSRSDRLHPASQPAASQPAASRPPRSGAAASQAPLAIRPPPATPSTPANQPPPQNEPERRTPSPNDERQIRRSKYFYKSLAGVITKHMAGESDLAVLARSLNSWKFYVRSWKGKA